MDGINVDAALFGGPTPYPDPIEVAPQGVNSGAFDWQTVLNRGFDLGANYLMLRQQARVGAQTQQGNPQNPRALWTAPGAANQSGPAAGGISPLMIGAGLVAIGVAAALLLRR